MRKYCILDFETRSPLDLKKTGGFEYTESSLTEIICCAISIGTKRSLPNASIRLVPLLNPENRSYFFIKLYDLYCKGLTFVAHNAFFEHSIIYRGFLENYKSYIFTPENWVCTASMASYHGLPRSLDGVSQALGLKDEKDKIGHKLMLKLSKLRPDFSYFEDEAEYKRLYEYCIQDVLVEREVFLALDELPEKEKRIWCLDQRMNFIGVNTNTRLATKAVKQVKYLNNLANKEVSALSHGSVQTVKQRDVYLKLIQRYDSSIENLQKAHLKEKLHSTKNKTAKKLIQLRLDNSLTSVAKYKALLDRVSNKGRIHDHLVYHGAGTGRWTASGLQVQNLPRGESGFDYETKREALLKGDTNISMQDLSSLVRTVITPSEGCRLFCGDFAGIELRVLMWLVNQTSALDMIKSGQDLYKNLACKIYDKNLQDIEFQERQVGKHAVLGCGYGMGAKKFKQTVKDIGGLVIADKLADLAVYTYRNTFKKVVEFWYGINNTCIEVVKTKRSMRYGHKLIIEYNKGFLSITLPAGRKLHYYKPNIEIHQSMYGGKPQLGYLSINGVTRKFERTRTYGGMLTENIVQAIARDIMAEKMLLFSESDVFWPLFTVHDEIVTESECDSSNATSLLKSFKSIMESSIPWCNDLPLKVDAWQGLYYKK